MLLFALLSYSSLSMAQRSTNSAGISIYSASGQMSYTLGQLNHHSNGSKTIGTSASMTEGVLQAYNSLSFEPFQQDQIEIWPNPVSTILFLKLAKEPLSTIPIEIYDYLGQCIGNYDLTAKNASLSMRGYPTGAYLLKVILPKQLPLSFKIIKL